VAMSDHIQEVELIEGFVLDMGLLCNLEVVNDVHLVYQDNQLTITIVTKGGGQARTKYMKVREEYVRERLETKQLEIEYVKTDTMLADVLTKPLSGEDFHKLVRLLRGRSKFQTSYASNMGAKKKVSRAADQDIRDLGRKLTT
jgi:hypothetical protein